ncbi:unnamed protein product [Adineta steineri]|uniref:F-box domain-containing protein n=1 Tax=Adineta steineri TaxID=433720 RepID=A0A819KKC8_9BILA|nr:unnamed protein product [Adineta steineri]
MEFLSNINSITWLDRFPIEIIFEIFDYLSNNDIIYTFFSFNKQFNNILIRHRRYFTNLELPSTNFDTWEPILSYLGSKIESLIISTIDFSFPLIYFSNLKSIIIPSTYGLPKEQLKYLLDCDQFNNLHTFKLKQKKLFCDQFYYFDLIDQNYLFKKIFNSNNSLKIFEYPFKRSSLSITHYNSLQINSNLHSLTLILSDFNDIFKLISYTPNLEYLNIQTLPPITSQEIIYRTNIKLKQFNLKLGHDSIDFNQLMNGIKQFSSSLISLSLDLIDLNIETIDELPFNSIKLQQFLQTMIELKQFHLYAKLQECPIDNENFLLGFQNQFWLDHNWRFGMHEKYFYTLPFHFDYLYEFSNNFKTNYRLWYSNVKSLELCLTEKYNFQFLKDLKIQMPKLNLIKFISCDSNKNEMKNNITFDNVTTCEYNENVKDWILYRLPNLKHLILSSKEFISIDNQVAEIFNKKILYLDIKIHSDVDYLPEISYMYWSNVQYISLYLCYNQQICQCHANHVIKILKYFQNLKILTVYLIPTRFDSILRLNKFIESLNADEVLNNYQVKHFGVYSLFSKIIL